MGIKDLTENQIIALRNEIVLNSLFMGDYHNSFAIEPTEVCDFFDGFVSWAYENWKETHDNPDDFSIEDIDTVANLIEYFYTVE